MLLAYLNKQYIACADNSLLTMIIDGAPQRVVGLPLPQNGTYNTCCTGNYKHKHISRGLDMGDQ